MANPMNLGCIGKYGLSLDHNENKRITLMNEMVQEWNETIGTFVDAIKQEAYVEDWNRRMLVIKEST
jgi:hypothetical protein